MLVSFIVNSVVNVIFMHKSLLHTLSDVTVRQICFKIICEEDCKITRKKIT